MAAEICSIFEFIAPASASATVPFLGMQTSLEPTGAERVLDGLDQP